MYPQSIETWAVGSPFDGSLSSIVLHCPSNSLLCPRTIKAERREGVVRPDSTSESKYGGGGRLARTNLELSPKSMADFKAKSKTSFETIDAPSW